MSCANDPNIIFSKYNDVKNWWGCFLFFNFYEAHHDVIETITDSKASVNTVSVCVIFEITRFIGGGPSYFGTNLGIT